MGSAKRSKKPLKRNKRSKCARKMHATRGIALESTAVESIKYVIASYIQGGADKQSVRKISTTKDIWKIKISMQTLHK